MNVCSLKPPCISTHVGDLDKLFKNEIIFIPNKFDFTTKKKLLILYSNFVIILMNIKICHLNLIIKLFLSQKKIYQFLITKKFGIYFK